MMGVVWNMSREALYMLSDRGEQAGSVMARSTQVSHVSSDFSHIPGLNFEMLIIEWVSTVNRDRFFERRHRMDEWHIETSTLMLNSAAYSTLSKTKTQLQPHV